MIFPAPVPHFSFVFLILATLTSILWWFSLGKTIILTLSSFRTFSKISLLKNLFLEFSKSLLLVSLSAFLSWFQSLQVLPRVLEIITLFHSLLSFPSLTHSQSFRRLLTFLPNALFPLSFLFNGRIIASQCCNSFWCTITWISLKWTITQP